HRSLMRGIPEASWGRRGRVITEQTLAMFLQRGMLPAKRSHEDSDLILFFNSMFGELYPPSVPAGWVVSTDLRRFREARAVVFHVPSLGSIERLRKPPGQRWVAWWMECDQHFPQVADPEFMSRFDLTMSYRLDADVFSPYFNFRWRDDGEPEL